MFELLEYSFEHQLPNFSECWWDHWIMDALLCNGFGIYLGMRTLKYLNMKEYNWRGMWTIHSFKYVLSKIILKQYNWRGMWTIH